MFDKVANDWQHQIESAEKLLKVSNKLFCNLIRFESQFLQVYL